MKTGGYNGSWYMEDQLDRSSLNRENSGKPKLTALSMAIPSRAKQECFEGVETNAESRPDDKATRERGRFI